MHTFYIAIAQHDGSDAGVLSGTAARTHAACRRLADARQPWHPYRVVRRQCSGAPLPTDGEGYRFIRRDCGCPWA